MYCNSFYEFAEEEAGKTEEYKNNKIRGQEIRLILDQRKDCIVDNLEREWWDICDKKEKMESLIEKEYMENVLYSLNYFDSKASIMSIGFYNNKFYILDENSNGYEGEIYIILFDSKEEFLKYMKLDELGRFIAQH
jgi:hypothetical protein